MTEAKDGRPRLCRGLLTSTVLAVGVLCISGPLSSVALAHAERTSSQPEEGSRLDKPPSKVVIDFSEPPTGDAQLVVMDGCENDVVQEVTVSNQQIAAQLSQGQPGRWAVRSTVVSGVDAHQTKDGWSFEVEGERDCSAAPAQPDDEGDAGGEEEDDSSFPFVPVAIGTVVVLGAALLLRALTGRSDD